MALTNKEDRRIPTKTNIPDTLPDMINEKRKKAVNIKGRMR